MKLEKTRVEIVECNVKFKEAFDVECERLKTAFKRAEILHVGSSSIGIPTKPTVDILIAVSEFKIHHLEKLIELGYVYIGYADNNGARRFLIFNSNPYNIYLHIVRKAGKAYRNITSFKEILQKEPIIRDAYVELKYKLAYMYCNQPEAYSTYKGWFIKDIIKNYGKSEYNAEKVIEACCIYSIIKGIDSGGEIWLKTRLDQMHGNGNSCNEIKRSIKIAEGYREIFRDSYYIISIKYEATEGLYILVYFADGTPYEALFKVDDNKALHCINSSYPDIDPIISLLNKNMKFICKVGLEEKLYHRFPWLKREPYWCGDGWFQLLWELCEELEDCYKKNNADINTLEIDVIKEKYGYLRFNANNLIEEAHAIVSKHEKRSEEVCDICGEPGSLHINNDWLQTLCGKCAAEEGYSAIEN